MGELIPIQSLDEQIDGIQSQLDAMRDEFAAGVQELLDRQDVYYKPLRDRLLELKTRRGDKGFREGDYAG